MFWNMLKGGVLSVGAFFVPIKALVIAVVALVMLDAVAGMLASSQKGEKITAAKLRRTVSKLLIYTVGILAGHAAQVVLPELGFPLANIIAASVGVVEIKSILENVGAVTGQSIFGTLISKIGSPNDKPTEPADGSKG